MFVKVVVIIQFSRELAISPSCHLTFSCQLAASRDFELMLQSILNNKLSPGSQLSIRFYV